MLFTRFDNSVHVEMFELSPLYKAVTSTKGRLRRLFPGFAVSVPLDIFQSSDFLATVAHTLTTMSNQPTKRYSTVKQELQETADPKMVTELFATFLLSKGETVEVTRIFKNTREEVFQNGTSMPWNRSALWLLIRVALQIHFSRTETSTECQEQTYKVFMVFLATQILDMTPKHSISSDLLSAMCSKLSRRCQKLVEPIPGYISSSVESTLQATHKVLQDRWSEIQNPRPAVNNLEQLRSLDAHASEDVLLRLPKLDDFIAVISQARASRPSTMFDGTCPLDMYDASDTPKLSTMHKSTNVSFKLLACEHWVSSCLEEWLESNISNPSTCGVLRGLIEDYHREAFEQYEGNPEGASIMVLTLLELWVASDKSAVQNCPLLSKYKLGIPENILDSLILPLRCQMNRLRKIENYLRDRSCAKGAKFSLNDIFDFGTDHCLSVQYFDESSELRTLRDEIESRASTERARKREEYKRISNEYRDLRDKAEKKPHEYTNYRHARNCKKCELFAKANDLQIHPHIWPLPEKPLEAKSTVFELRVPKYIGHWRDTLFMILQVFGLEYRGAESLRGINHESQNPEFRAFSERQNITLRAAKKSRSPMKIATVVDDQVCQPCGLQYKYYQSRECGVKRGKDPYRIPRLCTYMYPSSKMKEVEVPPLTRFFYRPHSKASGPPPNSVLATQCECPDDLSLEEYKALATIPLGYRIQWQNILVQIALPSLDFNKELTAFVILQCIYQAGPREDEDLVRESHKILSDEQFTDALLRSLEEAWQRIEKNWQSFQALGIYVALTRRVLSLTPTEKVKSQCLELLGRLRKTALEWIETLVAASGDVNSSLRKKAVEIALICVDTFNVDDEHLLGLLASSEDASIMIQCAIAIHEGLHHIPKSPKTLTYIMHQRWEQLAYRAFNILVDEVVERRNNALDTAIRKYSSTLHVKGNWKTLPRPCDHWVFSTLESEESIHFSLLTGELLVNGTSLGRLPKEYENHAMHRTLFGDSILEVLPVTVGRMRYSSKNRFKGHALNLALGSSDGSVIRADDLLIRAMTEDESHEAYELVPPHILEGSLPTMFVKKYIHWYNAAHGYLELCPHENPWSHSEENWKLVRTEDGKSTWKLVKGRLGLIAVSSPTAKVVSRILEPLEERYWIHIILEGPLLDIELPRLNLGFSVRLGETSVVSRQFRGMRVDENQNIGTLFGLSSKLVLKAEDDRSRRKVLIPNGNITFEGTQQHVQEHVQVKIEKSSSTRIHAFEVDGLLGRLLNSQSLQDRLLVSYLHALTSFPLPDPLTRRTGTEEALTILKSAAVRSFKFLTKENIQLLTEIAHLTPTRKYYSKLMQTVDWSSLGFLSQHGEFFKIVQSIFDQARSLNFFYPELPLENIELHKFEPSLLQRDLIRSSTFRVLGFGAEDYTTDADKVDYQARDGGPCSEAASRAFAMSIIASREPFSLVEDVQEDLWSRIWCFLKDYSNSHSPAGKMEGYESEVTPSLNYADLLLDGYKSDIAKNWIPLHRLLASGTVRPTKFQVMMWLATLSFTSDHIDMDILQVLASFFVAPAMSLIQIPRFKDFDLECGYDIDNSDLETSLEDSIVPRKDWPEAQLQQEHGESAGDFDERRQRIRTKKKDEALRTFVDALTRQWPCEVPDYPCYSTRISCQPYIMVDYAMTRARRYFEPRYHNHKLKEYLQSIEKTIPRKVTPVFMSTHPLQTPPFDCVRRPSFICLDEIFSCQAPTTLPPMVDDVKQLLSGPRILSLLSRLSKSKESEYERKYLEDLQASARSLQDRNNMHYSIPGREEAELRQILIEHLNCCQGLVDDIYDAMYSAVTPDQAIGHNSLYTKPIAIQQLPRFSPSFFLERLCLQNREKLPEGWRNCIVHYACALTQRQRAERLLGAIGNITSLTNELNNSGHMNWNPLDHPESLLLEIESDILIREVQEEIAAKMRENTKGNAVMQLNMGEGKSSVIVPMVATSLADGSQLVRVIVGKAQSNQMYHMLISKLGGLLNRRIYHVPFSRAVKLGHTEIGVIQNLFDSCLETGGILLVQPEHILSFKLMGIECTLTGKESMGKSLVQSQQFLNEHTRDIVDESDDNFSVKFELVYTVGLQNSTEHSPRRWTCTHEVLDRIRNIIPELQSAFPTSIETHHQSAGCFPRTRILRQDAGDELISRIAEEICKMGLDAFPITREPERVRKAVLRYISQYEPDPADIEIVENEHSNGLWADLLFRKTLLLLRGLIAGGILTFAFAHKRWRVDYGLDSTRQPNTKLAVPYRAKDNPSPRSEFSHPDVIIIFTSLSYYYRGLEDEELFQAFGHLLKSDEAVQEYQVWVKDAQKLPDAFRQLVGVNTEDDMKCTQEVFPHLKYEKGVIDYFLAHIVFPKEMKVFPHKLSASGWDLGAIKGHRTTGFSGTNDSREVLPLDVEQLDLDAQRHTNALVLEYLLGPENSVELMPRGRDEDTMAEMLLNTITIMDPPTRVILDVGAQILELTNYEVARAWLKKTSGIAQIQAAIYFNDKDEMCVMDRKNHIETLHTSPFATQLDVCVVFLDEAHTRGTDLKLPKDCRAAVTLGANLTKDRLVQGKSMANSLQLVVWYGRLTYRIACMRMRMLGQGQSVVFCVPDEIQTKIRQRRHAEEADNEGISVLDILVWAIGETWEDIHRSIGMWESQGRRYEQHKALWKEADDNPDVGFDKALAERYREDEGQTLEHRYRPRPRPDSANSCAPKTNDITDPISLRCSQFKHLQGSAAALQEEEERELSPEMEEEREDQRPPRADPAPHSLHEDIKTFVLSGTLSPNSTAYMPAFSTLANTAAGALFPVAELPTRLLVSADFATTIAANSPFAVLDAYQRPVQWILTSSSADMIVISPFEAHELLPLIHHRRTSHGGGVALHVYAPRVNLEYRRLDTLDLYTVPAELKGRRVPLRLVTELNLFAGQLYFASYEQYVDACKFIGVSWEPRDDDDDEDSSSGTNRKKEGEGEGGGGAKVSPVAFFTELHTKIRRNCQTIDKTHMGKLLGFHLLAPSDFREEGMVEEDVGEE